MMRNLRLLAPSRLPAANSRSQARGATAMFWCGVSAIVLSFFLTTNVLTAMGITVNFRVHPTSAIVFLGAMCAFAQGAIPCHQRCREAPGLMLFVFGVPMLSLYVYIFDGISGTAFWFDSFWAPALLALLLEPASDKQKRTLAKLLLALVILNALIGLFESVTHYNWFPFIPPDPDFSPKQLEIVDDFRANAFYGHPLLASLITGMACFLLYGMRLRLIFSAPIFALFTLALLEFGGRTALFVTVVVSGLAASYLLVVGLVRRDLKLDFMLTVGLAIVIMPLMVAVIVTRTTIAERIIDTLYFDDSAQVRTMQWVVLNYLSLKNWLFGVPLLDLQALKYQIGLEVGVEDIENFWLLVFLNLGAIGFVAFLGMFAGFLVHIARSGRNMNAWLLMISALVIDSGSNSLGQKSNDLFIEVAFLVAMSGFASLHRQPRARQAASRVRLRDRPEVLGAIAAKDRGLRLIGVGAAPRAAPPGR